MVVVPGAKVVARPALTGALAIVATVGTLELQWELMLTSWVEPSLKVPVATNCSVAPVSTVALVGQIPCYRERRIVWPEAAERRAASRISVTITLVSRDDNASTLAPSSSTARK